MFFRFDEFVEEVMDCIKDYMPRKYQSYNYGLQTINKGATSYTGLVIRDGDATGATPVVNLDKIYAAYEDDYNNGDDKWAFYTAIDRIVDIRTKNEVTDDAIMESVLKFDEKKVFIRLINTESNKEYIKNKPHFEVSDLTALFTYRMPSPVEGAIAEIVITDDLCASWDIPSGMLRAYANQNIKDAPYYFEDLAKVSGFPISLGVYVLTNVEKVWGGYELLNPVALETIGEKFGDFYILPCSVNELIVIPKSKGDKLNGLREIVQMVNSEEVAPEEQLSDNIYEYDCILKEVRIVR